MTGNKITDDIDANQLLRIPRGGGGINVPKKVIRMKNVHLKQKVFLVKILRLMKTTSGMMTLLNLSKMMNVANMKKYQNKAGTPILNNCILVLNYVKNEKKML